MAENQVKVRPALTDLKVGGEITFPIAKPRVCVPRRLTSG